jgi:putative heme-binding domain-containing protein
LINALSKAAQPARRQQILQALARLHNREGVWRGTLAEWWGTRPDTTGPYYDPVAWEESARIRAVLLSALLESAPGGQGDVKTFATVLERNRVLPAGGAAVLSALASDRQAPLADVARALIGRVRLEIDPPTAQLLDRAGRAGNQAHAAVVAMIVAAGPASPVSAGLLHAAATDASLSAELRASAFSAIAASTSPDALRRSIDAFSALAVPALDPELERVWTQFVTTPGHATQVAAFRELVEGPDQAKQRLGFAVLLQLASDPPAGRGGRGAPGGGRGGRGRGGLTPAIADNARTESRAIVDGAWNSPAAASLVWAVGRTGAVRYQDRVASLVTSTQPAVRDAAAYASERLAALAPAPAAAPAATAGPAVSSIAYEELATRVAAVSGDAALGRKLFAERGCAACHTTAPGEPEKGPYLGGIFTRYSRPEVLESIVRPAAKVAQGFATNWFTTTDKRQVAGFVVREGQEEVLIRDLAGTETTLRKASIAERGVNEGSTMPPGLVDTLTLHELASLLAFLESTSAK